MNSTHNEMTKLRNFDQDQQNHLDFTSKNKKEKNKKQHIYTSFVTACTQIF